MPPESSEPVLFRLPTQGLEVDGKADKEGSQVSETSKISECTPNTSIDSGYSLSADEKTVAAGTDGPPPVDSSGKVPTTGTTETDPVEAELTPSIVYHVKYQNAAGEIKKVEKPKSPFKLNPTTADFPVLDVTTVITSINNDKVASSDSKNASGSTGDTENPDMGDPVKNPEDFKVSETTLRIRSQKLLNALRAVVKYYPGQTLLGDTVTFSEPFRLLVHHRAELEEYKSQNPEGHSEEYKRICNQHIDVLLDFLKAHFGKSLEDEELRHKQTPPVCTFEYVWLLLKPGEPCYLNWSVWTRYKYQPYTIKKVSGGMVQGRPTTYEISIWNVSCDGYVLGRDANRCAILPFDGEKEIESLLIFPARFHKDSPEELKSQDGLTLEQKFIRRGEKFWELTNGYSYKEYDGPTVTKPYRQINGRIMVDFDTYYAERGNLRPYLSGEYVPDESEDGDETATGTSGCECEHCSIKVDRARQAIYQDYDCVNPKKEPPNRDNFFFLCSHTVPAFILNERKWELLDAELVKDADIQSDAFKYLVLDTEILDCVEGLCRTHMKSRGTKPISADFIKGKGEGLIFLLHGPPGVGKTCTAECVAELLERPLLSLTCSDLGTTAESVTKALGTYLTLGEFWNAVVLLDEADIYLEHRAKSDMKRNSVVSVFLRAMEYYRGLLFLTTNRVKIFDEAFKSRIHVPLHYKRLGATEQIAIWKNCFDRIEKDSVCVSKKAKQYVLTERAPIKLDWNGREIQNAFQTAVALAQFEAQDEDKNSVIVKKKHIKRVVQMSKLFSDYLESVNGGNSDEALAFKKGLRNAPTGQPKPSKKTEVAAAAASKAKHGAGKMKAEQRESDEDDTTKPKNKGNSKNSPNHAAKELEDDDPDEGEDENDDDDDDDDDE